ncbi:MAG: phosphate acyltransferase PlsX [Ruminococcus sp.]|nr:phosphate acyltransferase PlsX [Ruminococcus sp.]
MNILIDAFGGDNAPLEVIKGGIQATQELDVTVTLVGDMEKLQKCAEKNKLSLDGLEILHAPSVFDIHAEPTTLLKQHRDTSLAVGLEALHDGKGDAFVCAGSTGALLVGASVLVKRVPGIKRAAAAPVLPTQKKPFLLIDGGANNDCRSEMLVQFGIMGSAYMQHVMHVRKPRVALLNVGAEETKGRELDLETYQKMEEAPVHFIGNIEARQLPFGEADVVVTDGFTGNVALKLYEGMGKFMATEMKENLFAGASGKLAALLILPKIKALTKKMDYKAVGGAVMLGVQKPVIKAHGSSDAQAFFNAIRQAKDCVTGEVIDAIAEAAK